MPENQLYITTITWNLNSKQPTPEAIQDILNASKFNKPIGAEELIIILSQEEGLAAGQFSRSLNKKMPTFGHHFETMTSPPTKGYVSAYCFSNTTLFNKPRGEELIDQNNGLNKNKGGVIVNVDLQAKEGQVAIQFASVHLESYNHEQRLAETMDLMDKFHGDKLILNFEELAKTAKPIQLLGGDFNLRYEYNTNQSHHDPSTQTLLPQFGMSNQVLEKTMVSINGDIQFCENLKEYSTYNKDLGAEFKYDKQRNSERKDKALPGGDILKVGHLDDVFISVTGEIAAQQTILVKKQPNDGRYDVSDHVPVIRTMHVLIPSHKHDIIKKWVLNKIKVFCKPEDQDNFEKLIMALDLNHTHDQIIITEYYNLYALLRELHVCARSITQLNQISEPNLCLALLTELENIISNDLLRSNSVNKYNFYYNLNHHLLKIDALFKNPPARFKTQRVHDFIHQQLNQNALPPTLIISSDDVDSSIHIKDALSKKVNETIEDLINQNIDKIKSIAYRDKTTAQKRIEDLSTLKIKISDLLNTELLNNIIISQIESALIDYLDIEIQRKDAENEFINAFEAYKKDKLNSNPQELRICFELTEKPYDLEHTGDHIRNLLRYVSTAHPTTPEAKNKNQLRIPSPTPSSSHSNSIITNALTRVRSLSNSSDNKNNSTRSRRLSLSNHNNHFE